MEITVKELQEWLADFATEVKAKKDYLSELDTPIGDGDHGNNMARGMEAYEESLAKQKPTTISDTFKILAMALISKVGGASGPLYGSAFMNITKATKDITVITHQAELGSLLETGLKGIQQRGKAEAGDKTMVDVWFPVVTALKEESLTSEKIEAAKESTKNLVAKKGRASYLGERAVGHIDPGAASSALLFTTLLKFC
ncbi:dihydroxyacetone kinase subunit L [Enterococcus saigonensis]|uniref:phosphoenolpyruvate--glycerone phosphotransferase n=1 Tax=Enterococcus saigonensis TaxID=1805431 RepID=A0A679INT2_9ENTE|nr:dihydroxyacetone kinase subunit DhaL [Enterococcus saigonensis]BCA86511.1 dihydroxyacetone kinase subunit L [Enterococcus saigonensis]